MASDEYGDLSKSESSSIRDNFWDEQLEARQNWLRDRLSSLSPSAFRTPLPDSCVQNTPAQSPYSYDASPQSWQGGPRSMSFAIQAPTPSINLHGTSVPQAAPLKQIRFVPNDGQPHTKRRRINAACLTCRKRKVRCSGERPECNTCTEGGQNCSGYANDSQRKTSRDEDDENDSNGDNSDSKDLKRSSSNETSSKTKSGQHLSSDHLSSSKIGDRDEGSASRSPASNQTVGSLSSTRHSVPYFRYFGPTAIVPGFKQMVVQMKDHRRSTNSAFSSGGSPASAAVGGTLATALQGRPPVDIPFYDATDPNPNAHLITHLCETFFTHLGCNYPFLQRERFLRDLEEKKVDAILVDAVCAVAARFSPDPLLAIPSDQTVPANVENEVKKPFRGHPFAQRAMGSLTETFPCPTIAVAQACLLLAYEEFGSDHDSGLWMYLGTSIRMAQDLGIQKLEGLQLEGRIGATPKTAKSGYAGKEEEARREGLQRGLLKVFAQTDPLLLEDRRASEQERIDTFYAIFFLDRAVSSGVGRPVTLRDKDIEISFPHRPDGKTLKGWPHPFPPMIRIVHMYGRVADVLNNIKEVDQVTPEVLKRLAGMEKDLTGIYQRLSPKLHFNATNFQHYVKAEQGTNFILLHFWFHTLIVLLHQPTLLHSFTGRIQQLFPDSRELSMSSAKTIADILAFAELIDVKSFIGNPFTSQPMYIAACAFLAEAAAHASQPASRGTSPPTEDAPDRKPKLHNGSHLKSRSDGTNKSSLLHSAANTNYQRCYKALKVLDSYWAGCRYILTALDQKSKGLMDPLLFTSEDVDGEMPSTVPSFTTPGWRRSISHSASMGGPAVASKVNKWKEMENAVPSNIWSPGMDPTQAIGWSLTGTANSPAPNLSFLYQSSFGDSQKSTMVMQDDRHYFSRAGEPGVLNARQHSMSTGHDPANRQAHDPSGTMLPPQLSTHSNIPTDPVSTAEADLLLGLNSPYSTSMSSMRSGTQPRYNDVSSHNVFEDHSQAYGAEAQDFAAYHGGSSNIPVGGSSANMDFGDMLIESQDIDMRGPQGNFSFPGGDMIPWLEYLPQDVLSYFGEPAGDASNAPSGPGPP